MLWFITATNMFWEWQAKNEHSNWMKVVGMEGMEPCTPGLLKRHASNQYHSAQMG